MNTGRRAFIEQSCALATGLLILPFRDWPAGLHIENSGIDEVIKALTPINDERAESLLSRQLHRPGGRWHGGVPNQYELPNAHSTSSFIVVLAAAYASPYSRYHLSAAFEQPLERAAACLLRVQHEDGTIDLHTTNFHSTPDTAFLVNDLSPAYACLKRLRQPGLKGFIAELETFLLNTGKCLLVGGVHTPNHRWVVCAALARLHSFFPNQQYVGRIDEWLGEGIDLDPDGQYTERSVSIYSPICNNMLLAMGRLLNRPELLEAVRKNLSMTLYYIQPGGEVLTVASRRQDSARAGYADQYYYAYRYFAILDKNREFAAACRLIETGMPERITGYILPLLEDPVFDKKMPAPGKIPDQYFKRFAHSGIFRIRRGETDISIIEQNPTFLAYRKGNAVLQSMRLGAAFFGKGQFESQEAEFDGETIKLKWASTGPYYQPAPADRRSGENDWEKVPREERTRSEVQALNMIVTIRESSGAVQVDVEIDGTAYVPVTWELSFRAGGALAGVTADPHVAGAYFLESGTGEYRLGNDVIYFGQGAVAHKWPQMRGMLPKQDGNSVYLTGYTPFRHSIVLSNEK